MITAAPTLPLVLTAAAASAASHGPGNTIGTLVLLVGLELVLGIDNVIVVAIITARLRPEHRSRARLIGLSLALAARIGMLLGVVWLMGLTAPLFSVAGTAISGRDLILLAGGAFLIAKASREIHAVVELREDEGPIRTFSSFGGALVQIVALDVVFSLDSVITAVGLTDVVWVILTAVVLSFVVVLAFAQRVGEFIIKRPSLKVLALSFLITIGVTLCIEAFDAHVPKAYLYLPMAFALVVQLLQMRLESNRTRRTKPAPTSG